MRWSVTFCKTGGGTHTARFGYYDRLLYIVTETETISKEKPYAGIDYNLTLCPLQSRLQHIYHGQPYARVDLSPMA